MGVEAIHYLATDRSICFTPKKTAKFAVFLGS